VRFQIQSVSEERVVTRWRSTGLLLSHRPNKSHPPSSAPRSHDRYPRSPMSRRTTTALSVGGRLRALRMARGLSQEALSQASGVSATVISRIERGAIAEPSLRTLRALVRALDVTLDELAGEDDPGSARWRRAPGTTAPTRPVASRLWSGTPRGLPSPGRTRPGARGSGSGSTPSAPRSSAATHCSRAPTSSN